MGPMQAEWKGAKANKKIISIYLFQHFLSTDSLKWNLSESHNNSICLCPIIKLSSSLSNCFISSLIIIVKNIVRGSAVHYWGHVPKVVDRNMAPFWSWLPQPFFRQLPARLSTFFL
jgi:hypothetical protein